MDFNCKVSFPEIYLAVISMNLSYDYEVLLWIHSEMEYYRGILLSDWLIAEQGKAGESVIAIGGI